MYLLACVFDHNSYDQVLLVYGRGSGLTDTKLVVREVGTERVVQEVLVGKPVLDIQVMVPFSDILLVTFALFFQAAEINGKRYLAAVGETELTMYKWE